MSNGKKYDKPACYKIRVKGNLGQEWSDWFDGFSIVLCDEECTTLTGRVADQAALHGLLACIRDLGLPIELVEKVENDGLC